MDFSVFIIKSFYFESFITLYAIISYFIASFTILLLLYS